MKPLSLWYELLNDLTNKGDVVLDTCMGSFTTAVACNKLQRHFIGAELDKDYFDKGLARLQKEQAQPSIFDIIKNSWKMFEKQLTTIKTRDIIKV